MGHEAVFELNCEIGPVTLRENYGFSRRELVKIAVLLDQNVDAICAGWERIHGIAGS